jgi:hypothetical protein
LAITQHNPSTHPTLAIGGPARAPVQRGIALVPVLWVVALLTVMVVGLITTQRSESALSQNQREGTCFRASSEAAINLAVLYLITIPIKSVDAQDVIMPDGQQPRVTNRSGTLYRMRISLRSGDGGAGRTMEALIEVQGVATPPFEVRWRRDGVLDRAPESDPLDVASQP